jgi:hypothetical protein
MATIEEDRNLNIEDVIDKVRDQSLINLRKL